MRIALFTAGTIGAGHLMHGLALARALKRQGFDGEFRLFGPPTEFAEGRALGFEFAPVALQRQELADPKRAPESALAVALTSWRPDLLLVDMFWAPLEHILPRLGCEAWLLVRKAPAKWLVGDATLRFVPETYARRIATEPIEHPLLPERVEPLVVANPDECQPREALRRSLSLPPKQQLAVVVHGGLRGELARLDPGLDHLHVLRLDAFTASSYWPAAEWLGGADYVFTGGGYNAVWEAVWLGYAARTHWTAFPRPIDDQAWRIRIAAQTTMRENGADCLARWAMQGGEG